MHVALTFYCKVMYYHSFFYKLKLNILTSEISPVFHFVVFAKYF